MNAKGADRHGAAYGHISSLAASQGQGIWSQRGHSLCQRHIPRIAPVQAVAMRHDLAPMKFIQKPGSLLSVWVKRKASAHALANPTLHKAPPVLDVVGGEPVRIDDLPGRMVHHLMPKVCITPAFFFLELLHGSDGRLPPICDQDSFTGDFQKP